MSFAGARSRSLTFALTHAKALGYVHATALALAFLLALPADLRAAEATIQLPEAQGALLGPDDTLELNLILNAPADGMQTQAPQVLAYLLAAGQAAPEAAAAAQGRVFAWASPTQSGTWHLHVRGLTPPGDGEAWDLLLRWSWPGTKVQGEQRLPGAIRFRTGLPDVVLLCDGSLSMGRNDPERLRVEAARMFVRLGWRSGGIGRVAVAQFDDHTRVLLPLTPVDQPAHFEPAFENLREMGQTDINGGIRLALKLLQEGAQGRRTAIVLLSDGKQEPGDYADVHLEAKAAGVPIHTLALGGTADRELLKRIADETGGTFSSAASGQELLHLYGAVAGRIAGGRTVLSTRLNSNASATFPADGSIRSLSASTLSDRTGVLNLKDPRGAAWPSEARAHAVMYLQWPAIGAWETSWQSAEAAAAQLELAAQTALYPLFFRAQPISGAPLELDADAPRAAFSLAEGAGLVPEARVELALYVNGSQTPLESGVLAASAGDGLYTALFEKLAAAQLPDGTRGEVRLVAQGPRLADQPFRREAISAWVLRRSARRTLEAPSAIEFGVQASGESLSAPLNIRVRGRGGPFGARLERAEALSALPQAPELAGVPERLEAQGSAPLTLNVTLPEALPPGLYGGRIALRVDADGRDEPLEAAVPWRVEVTAPALVLEPQALDLGPLWPGEHANVALRAATNAGRLRVFSFQLRDENRVAFAHPAAWQPAAPLRAARPALRLLDESPGLVALDRKGQAFELDFMVAHDAVAGPFEARVVLRDFDGVERASLPVRGRVRATALVLENEPVLGRLEPGDREEFPFSWRLDPAPPGGLLPAASFRSGGDDPARGAAQARVGAAGPNGVLTLNVAQPAPAGALTGWIELRRGPALLLSRWQAEVIAPALTLDPPELDFGFLRPGQIKSLPLNVTLRAARGVRLQPELPQPLAKPRFPEMQLEDALSTTLQPADILPGASLARDARIAVPESAQDGLYASALLLRTRLGEVRVPVRVRVQSPIPIPPFHVTPTEVKLRILDSVPEAPLTLVLTSHRDEDLAIRLHAEPGPGSAQACALILDASGRGAAEAKRELPGRARLSVLIQAHPDAVDGETGLVVLEGERERQAVRVRIERVDSPPTAAAPRASPLLDFFDWVRLLVLLLLLLLVLLARALLKRRWVRYATYAMLLHAAFFLIAIPPGQMVGALPESVQITLLTTQDDWGGALSPEQRRRLDELGASADAGGGAQAAAAESAPPGAGGHDLLQPEDLTSAAAAPAAAAPLASAQLEAAAPPPPAPESSRAAPSASADDAPLAALPVDRPVPAPAPQTPQPQPVRAESSGPVFASEPALELPSRDPREAQPRAAPEAAWTPPQASAQPAVAPRTPAPVQERPTREAPAVSDLPFFEAPLDAPAVAQATPVPAAAPNSEARTTSVSGSAPPAPAASTLAAAVTTRQTGSAPNAQPLASSTLGDSQAPSFAAALSGPAHAGKAAGSVERSGRGAAGGSPGDPALDFGAPNTGSAGNGSQPGATGSGSGPQALPGARGSGLGALLEGGAGNDLAALGRLTGTSLSGAGGPRATHGGLAPGPQSGSGSGIDSSAGHANGTQPGAAGRAASGSGKGDAPLDLGSAPGTGGRGQTPGPGAADAGKGTGRAEAAGSGLGFGGAFGPGSGTDLAGLPGGMPSAGPSMPRTQPYDSHADYALAWADGKSRDPSLSPGPSARNTGLRPQWGHPTHASLKLVLGLARHRGDWNSSPTALFHLAAAFRERCGLPDVTVAVREVGLEDRAALNACTLVLLTSNDPVPLNPLEEKGLQAYLAQGGTLWVNDSSASGDERFDRAFLAQLAKLWPHAPLRLLPSDHHVFASAYELREGYKGYRIPPGDKFREQFFRGLDLPDGAGEARTALFYTRNDYADGLEIDPRMTAGRLSLTDLTPDEMLEGSLRVGINLIAYALKHDAPRFPPPPEGSAHDRKLYRYEGPPLPVFDSFVVAEAGGLSWKAEDWGSPATVEAARAGEFGGLRVRFQGSAKMKAAVARELDLDLSAAKALVFDLHSSLPHGINAALLYQTAPDFAGFETRPVFVRPGWNRGLRFPLELDDFKSSKNEWKTYDTPFRPRTHVRRLAILLYNQDAAGTVLLQNLRIEK